MPSSPTLLRAPDTGGPTAPAVASTLAPVWQITVILPAHGVPALEAALEPLCGALSTFEIEDEETNTPTGDWRVEGFAEEKPDPAALAAGVSLAAAAANIPEPTLSIIRIEGRDWLTENLLSFPPMDIGRFRILGSHIDEARKPGRLVVQVDAATAFGSGDHPSTRGCLLAYEQVAKRIRPAPTRVLDMGAGSGILSIGAARRWPGCSVLGADIDAESVRVARFNVARNGLGHRIRMVEGAGPRAPGVTGGGPYGLIFANILARPLRGLAGPLSRLCAPGGRVILAGLLTRQEAYVLDAWRARGMILESRWRFAPWSTLVLRKPGQ